MKISKSSIAPLQNAQQLYKVQAITTFLTANKLGEGLLVYVVSTAQLWNLIPFFPEHQLVLLLSIANQRQRSSN